jgi:hypothetical protein
LESISKPAFLCPTFGELPDRDRILPVFLAPLLGNQAAVSCGRFCESGSLPVCRKAAWVSVRRRLSGLPNRRGRARRTGASTGRRPCLRSRSKSEVAPRYRKSPAQAVSRRVSSVSAACASRGRNRYESTMAVFRERRRNR